MAVAAEIALARTTADDIARRLANGGIGVKRRKASHIIVRALRFYAAAIEFEVKRGIAPEIKAANGGGCSRAPVCADQSSQEAAVCHAATMRHGHEQNPEKLFTEIGKSGDRGDALCHR